MFDCRIDLPYGRQSLSLFCLIDKHFTFYREIIQTFDISTLQTRVAIVEYSSSARLSVALNNYGSKTRLMCAVNELRYSSKSLNCSPRIDMNTFK